MCRHVAYLGPPVTLRSVIIEPPHGLYHQAWAPRFQRHGTVNADGFGVGWYCPVDPAPARYRRTIPIWGDESFADVARVTRASAVLAAVRCATPGTDLGPAPIAPFTSGPWLFSHNGVIDGWPGSAAGLATTLPPDLLLGLEARVSRRPGRHRRDARRGRGNRPVQLPADRWPADRRDRRRRHPVVPPGRPGPGRRLRAR
jgi:glutamine amidotransferase